MRRIHLLGIAASVGTMATAALAADIYVPSGVPTIQGAINLAQDGDRVLVAPGTYFETIDFSGKGLTLQSVGGIVQPGGGLYSFSSGDLQPNSRIS